MKILILSEFFPANLECDIRGGVETRAFFIAKNLAKNHKVIVLASHEKNLPRKDNFGGITVIRCGPTIKFTQAGSLFKRLMLLIDFYKTGIKIKNVDIVDGYSLITYIPAYWIAKKLKKISIMTVHDVWIGQWMKLFGIMGIIGEIYERYIYSRPFNFYITNSNVTKKKLIKQKIPSEKIQTVYGGVDIEVCQNININKYPQPTICAVARLVKYKKIDDLIKSIKIIKKEMPEIKCKIIGSGPEKNNLQELVKQLNLESNIKFLGFIKSHNDVLKTIKQSHIFSLPSEIEGLGQVTIEAMACGTPYVNSNIKPTIEATENGKGGELYQLGSIQELANKIRELLTNKEKYKIKVEEAKKVSAKYNWVSLSKQIEQIYRQAIL